MAPPDVPRGTSLAGIDGKWVQDRVSDAAPYTATLRQRKAGIIIRIEMTSLRQEWLSNIQNDLLAGIVVALALIPEAIAFSIIAGVDPKVGLYASFCIAAVVAFAGGRPGMISAATGAMALVMVT